MMLLSVALAFIVEFVVFTTNGNALNDGTFWFNVLFNLFLQLMSLTSMITEGIDRGRNSESYGQVVDTLNTFLTILKNNGLITKFVSFCKKKTKKLADEARQSLLDNHGLEITDVDDVVENPKNFSKKQIKAVKNYIRYNVKYRVINSGTVLNDTSSKVNSNYDLSHSMAASIIVRAAPKVILSILISIAIAIFIADISTGFNWVKAMHFGWRLFLIVSNAIAGFKIGYSAITVDRAKSLDKRITFINEFAEDEDLVYMFNPKYDSKNTKIT